MPLLIGISLLGLLVTSVQAGPEVIIRERAKELRDQNNVRQGVQPPTQANSPGYGAAAAAPAASPALTKFAADLAALKAGVPATAAQKQQLARDLVLMAQGAKPALATAAKLVDDLAVAFEEKPLSAASRGRLTQELDAVLNPAKYPQAKMDGIFADAQAIFQDNGAARKIATAISADIKALAAEIQKGGA